MSEGVMNKHIIVSCPACWGDGMEICTNPDHGFIAAVGGEIGRLGCPCCGHDPYHKTGETCWHCKGTGEIELHEAARVFADLYPDGIGA